MMDITRTPLPITLELARFPRLGPWLIRGLSTTSIPSSAVRKNVAVPGLRNGMDYATLGDSDLVVSKVCMGTMVGFVKCHLVIGKCITL